MTVIEPTAATSAIDGTGGAGTVTLMLTALEATPLPDARIVIALVPGAAPLLTAIVTTLDVDDAAIVTGLRETLIPAGTPSVPRVTSPAKPPPRDRVSDATVLVPTGTTTAAVLANRDTVGAGAGVTGVTAFSDPAHERQASAPTPMNT